MDQTQVKSGVRSIPASLIRVALMIALSVILVRLTGTFSGEKMRFLYKSVLHLSASEVATLGIITGIPAYLRPFMGAASDLFPIFGYHRRSYFALSWLVYGLGYLGLAFLHSYHVATVVLLVIVAGSGAGLLFVVMDAVMVAVGNPARAVGRFQSIQQFLPLALGLTLAHLGGWVTQHWSYERCFVTAACCALAGIPIALLIDERPQSRQRRDVESDEEHAERMAQSREEKTRTARLLKRALRSPALWAMIAFVFYLIITPGTNTALFYYEVDSLKFSPQFIGDLGIFDAAGAMVAILVFAVFSRKLPFPAMVWGAYLMDCCLYLASMGIHDPLSAKICFFILAFLGMIYNLCLLTVAARACPPGVEGTIYGLVIAAIGLAGTLGEKMGSSIYDRFGPASHATTSHGWFMLLCIGFVFTIAAGIFIPFLPAWARKSNVSPEFTGD